MIWSFVIVSQLVNNSTYISRELNLSLKVYDRDQHRKSSLAVLITPNSWLAHF